jgi:hypothetical protein
MNLKKLLNKRSALIFPIALFVLLFGARCSDNKNDLNDQVVSLLLNCPGGTMTFTSGTARSWTCCRAVNAGTYWKIVGSGGSEAMQLFIGDATPVSHDDSTFASYEYIQFTTGGVNFYGVTDSPYNTGASDITVSSNTSSSITGSFTGTVKDGLGGSLTISSGSFTAVK